MQAAVNVVKSIKCVMITCKMMQDTETGHILCEKAANRLHSRGRGRFRGSVLMLIKKLQPNPQWFLYPVCFYYPKPTTQAPCVKVLGFVCRPYGSRPPRPSQNTLPGNIIHCRTQGCPTLWCTQESEQHELPTRRAEEAAGYFKYRQGW